MSATILALTPRTFASGDCAVASADGAPRDPMSAANAKTQAARDLTMTFPPAASLKGSSTVECGNGGSRGESQQKRVDNCE